MTSRIREHWREYLSEALLLGLFMASACVFGVLLEHPASPVPASIASAWQRRLLMGFAMGATAITLIRSRLGQRSGAHMNPGVTLTFLRLGKIGKLDAGAYVVAQFAGAIASVACVSALLKQLSHPAVNYVATVPGPSGEWAAFAAEILISFGMMSAVLYSSNHRRLHGLTPYIAGALVAVYITIEAPVSGMSMNPARTLGSAVSAHLWHTLWIYFIAPPLGMLLAGELYASRRGLHRVFCAKLHHHNAHPCIFRCRFDELAGG